MFLAGGHQGMAAMHKKIMLVHWHTFLSKIWQVWGMTLQKISHNKFIYGGEFLIK